MKIALLAATAAATLLAATSASALTFVIAYTSTGGAPATLNATVTTANVLNSVGGYDVTSISGNVAGDVITALTPNPNQPNQATTVDGLFFYDNVFFTAAPSVTNAGLVFTSAAFEYNFFSDNATDYELYQAAGGGYTANSIGTLDRHAGSRARDVGPDDRRIRDDRLRRAPPQHDGRRLTSAIFANDRGGGRKLAAPFRWRRGDWRCRRRLQRASALLEAARPCTVSPIPPVSCVSRAGRCRWSRCPACC